MTLTKTTSKVGFDREAVLATWFFAKPARARLGAPNVILFELRARSVVRVENNER
jgi:hypothetical protein